MRDMGDMRYGMKWDSHLGFIYHIIPHIYNLIYKWEIWDEMGSCSISLSKNGRYGMKFGIEYGTSNLWQSYIMGKYNNKPGAKTGTIRGYRICRQSQSCLGQCFSSSCDGEFGCRFCCGAFTYDLSWGSQSLHMYIHTLEITVQILGFSCPFNYHHFFAPLTTTTSFCLV